MLSFPCLLLFSAVAALSCSILDAFALHSSNPSFARRSPQSSSQLFYDSNGEFSDSMSKPYTSTTSAIGDDVRREWIDKSLTYYSKVMREERRRNLGQAKDFESEEYNLDFLHLAKKHYFALRKIKDGKPQHAELIYRKIIDEILHEDEDEGCDHAKLAVTTLLLALHLQRTGDSKSTRSVFLSFFRIVVAAAEKEPDHECACSAKVLQAFALFEMKQGHSLKSLEIVLKAIKLDPTLRPVLNWKQFRDVLARRRQQRQDRLQRQQQQVAKLADGTLSNHE
jgi:hypothetical protein